MSAKHKDDFYKSLRQKVRKWANSKKGSKSKWTEYVLLVPDFFHLLISLLMDTRISKNDKAEIVMVVVYFISPIDLIPEAVVGPIGYLDDLILTAIALDSIINSKGNARIVKEHWAGEGDILEQIKTILALAEDMIGSDIFRKIIEFYTKYTGKKANQKTKTKKKKTVKKKKSKATKAKK